MKKLSLKKRKFLKAYFETGNLAEAARRAGSKAKSAHSLSQVGYALLKSVDIYMKEFLDLNGLSDIKLIQVLADGLNATKRIPCNVIAKGGKGMKDVDSTTKKVVTIEDHRTRHKYLETAFKLKGYKV